MFSTKVTRAAHRASASASPAAALISSSSTSHPPTHPRRHSSSKASSCPPDDSATKAATTTKAAAGEPQPPKPSRGKAKGAFRPATLATGKSKKAAEPIDQFAGLPSVPAIHDLDLKDFTLSSFFSLHRPLSLSTTVPPPSTPASFSAIFNGQPADPWANGNSAERRPEDTVFALKKTIDALEKGRSDGETDDMFRELSGGNNAVVHLDGATRPRALEELVAQFKPFRPPPPPQVFVEEKKAAEQKTRGRPKKKTFRAMITVTESTYSDGVKTYSASSSPIVRLPEPTRKRTATRQPFLTRMAQRQRANSASSGVTMVPLPARKAPSAARQQRMRKPDAMRNMYLISVKRQRKLKMKKHKYKKLMKRTRNLRRRQDRA